MAIDFPTAGLTVGQTFTAAGVTWTWDGVKWLPSGLIPTVVPAINPNRLDNGDMAVDQHSNGASLAIGAGLFLWTPDRWSTGASKAKFTVGQNYSVATKAPGFQYFAGVQTTGTGAAPVAADYNQFAQGIEADAIGDLMWGTANAQAVTLSFWVNSSLTGSFGASFLSTGATYRAYCFSYNIPTANTWTKIVVTIPGDTGGTTTNWPNTGNSNGLSLVFDLGYGATGQTATVNAWQSTTTAVVPSGGVKLVATTNAKWAITGVKLEAGSVATAYPTEDLARKLARCQRYYQKLGGSGIVADVIINGYTSAGGLVACTIGINAMRAVPTAALIGTWNVTNSGSPSLYPGLSTLGLQLPAIAAGPVGFWTKDATTYITLSAEL